MRRKIGLLLMAAALLLPAAAQAQVRFPDYQYQPPGFPPMAPGVGIGPGGVGIGSGRIDGWPTPGIPDPYYPLAGIRNQLEPHGPGIPFPPDGFGRPGNPYQPFSPANGLPQRLGGPQIPAWAPNNATPPLQPINLPKVDFKPPEIKPSSSFSTGSYWTYGGIAAAVLAALCRGLGRAAGSSRGPSSRDRE